MQNAILKAEANRAYSSILGYKVLDTMKNKLFISLFVLALSTLASAEYSFAQDSVGLDSVVCIDQFPCHLKTGKLLPGFLPGTDCAWEKICQNYRKSPAFQKMQKKLKHQKRLNLKRNNPVHARK